MERLIFTVLQNVAKNKEIDMIPLWKSAKKTVDSGCNDLQNVIREKEAQNEVTEKKLIEKLKLVLNDLEGQSKVNYPVIPEKLYI